MARAKDKTVDVVDVVVRVSHDQLKRGDAGEVELTDDVRRLLDKGYLRLAEQDGEVTGQPLGAAVPAYRPVDAAGNPVSLLGVAPPGPGVAEAAARP